MNWISVKDIQLPKSSKKLVSEYGQPNISYIEECDACDKYQEDQNKERLIKLKYLYEHVDRYNPDLKRFIDYLERQQKDGGDVEDI